METIADRFGEMDYMNKLWIYLLDRGLRHSSETYGTNKSRSIKYIAKRQQAFANNVNTKYFVIKFIL